uniref:RING finger protein 227-like n=1 Tax=Petromyzon marinus TaxID=7757 RepID=A0AAJ7X1W2_PETMA|nr:RING finger protein 227-like [Petromyzon marinus]XP_032818013.1 RING finger protein 227-like [Petromyzon marinus]XP_032818014.1 RING finger protein 227-like [Petromyzon marinus]XP_032818015.1 RING finger protein 227-like [Petromyzon marinus]XP_032818016.1 RING finger protein 227-like [Petromyzon marinus]XP_032818017.1 RING finger protein 227-like [Petromyzon marinus]
MSRESCCEEMECGICYGEYSRRGRSVPKRLPACGHSFCGACVLLLARPQQGKGSSALPCPLCRALSLVPAQGPELLSALQDDISLTSRIVSRPDDEEEGGGHVTGERDDDGGDEEEDEEEDEANEVVVTSQRVELVLPKIKLLPLRMFRRVPYKKLF